MLNCLIIQSPTGHIIKGKFNENNWISGEMPVSQIDLNNNISPDKCVSS